MQCPQCNSENTQRLEVIFEQGTQNIQTTSNTTGAGYAGGSAGFAGATTHTSGLSQTVAAKRAAPPQMESPILFLMVANFAGLLFASMLQNLMGGLISMIVWAGASYWGYITYKKGRHYNENDFPTEYQQWRNSWMCNKCGLIYKQKSINGVTH